MNNREVAEAPERILVQREADGSLANEWHVGSAFGNDVEYALVKQPSATTLQIAETAAREWFEETQAVIDGQIDDPRLLTFNSNAQIALDMATAKLADIIAAALDTRERETFDRALEIAMEIDTNRAGFKATFVSALVTVRDENQKQNPGEVNKI